MSLVSDELRAAVGSATEPETAVVDRTLLRQLDEALDRAGSARGSARVAPLALLCTIRMRGPSIWERFEALLPPRQLDGGGRWEVHGAITLGDELTWTTEISSISERQGRSGPILLLEATTTWLNQWRETVATCRATTIRR